MVQILQDKQQAVAELCARFGVVRLDVFGSVLRDDFRPGESDVETYCAACEAIGRFLPAVDHAACRDAELTRSGGERQLILMLCGHERST